MLTENSLTLRALAPILVIALSSLAVYSQNDIEHGKAVTLSREEFSRLTGMQNDYSEVASRFNQKDFPGARAKATEFITKHSSQRFPVSYVYYMRALAHYEENRKDLALKDLTTAIELNSSAVWAYSYRGLIHFQDKRFDAATSDLNRAIEIADRLSKVRDMSSPLYKAANPFSNAFQPNFGAVAYSTRAKVNLAQHRLAAALSDARIALEISPFHGRAAHEVLGKLLEPKEYIAELTALIAAARREYPDPAKFFNHAEDLLHRRIDAYQDAEMPHEAIADLTFVIGQNEGKVSRDNIANSYMIRASQYFTINQMDSAMADLNRIIKFGISSSFPPAHYYRAQVYLRQNKFAEAISDLKVAIEYMAKSRIKSDFDASLFAERSRAYAMNNQLNLALADINKVVESGLLKPTALSMRAWIYCKMGRKSDAKNDETKVVSLGGKVAQPCQ